MKICFVWLALLFLPLTLWADYKDDIGYTALQVELGNLSIAIPTGAGVTVSQVEADGDGTAGAPYGYIPDTGQSQFLTDSISDVSGVSSSFSSHATMVGGMIYGNNSIAYGINSVGLYLAGLNNWLGPDFLNFQAGTAAPAIEFRDIQNHSWVGTTENTNADRIILNRLDYAVQRDDFVAVVGVNNGTGNERNLLSSAYNVISVGVSNGNHSYGDTTVNGLGRAVPQIVVPVGTTSEATAVVSAASALLIQQARTMGSANGEKSETIKAVLLAGAAKDELTTWSNSSSQPLDAIFGAGELNVQNSYHIMAAGEQNASNSTDVAATGWDYGSVDSSATQTYYLVLAEASSLSIALDWNAIVTPLGGNYDNTILSLANLDLRLYQATGYSLDGVVGESLSTVDNIEYVWDALLNPGRYAIEISSSSATSWEYALAWQAVAIPEPSSLQLLALGFGLLFFLIYRKKKISV